MVTAGLVLGAYRSSKDALGGSVGTRKALEAATRRAVSSESTESLSDSESGVSMSSGVDAEGGELPSMSAAAGFR